MYSDSFVEIISRCGGIFTNKIFSKKVSKSFQSYIKKHDIVDLISTNGRNQIGFLYKIKDEKIKDHYRYNSRERKRLLTHSGYKELNRRVKEYLKNKGYVVDIYHHRESKFYQEILNEILADDKFSRWTRYEISDYQIYKSLTKILFYLQTGILIYSTKMEKKFCSHLIDHRKITKGISYAKNYENGKDVVFFPDYARSEKSIIQMLEYYNDEKTEIYIFTMQPEEKIFFKLRDKIMDRGSHFINFKVLNDKKLNEIFGEY